MLASSVYCKALFHTEELFKSRRNMFFTFGKNLQKIQLGCKTNKQNFSFFIQLYMTCTKKCDPIHPSLEGDEPSRAGGYDTGQLWLTGW